MPGFSVFADKPRMRGLETGAFRLCLDPAPPPGPVLELAVDDIQAMTATLVAVGCAVVREDAWSPGAPSAIRSA